MNKIYAGALTALLAMTATVRSEPLAAEEFSHEAAYKDVTLSPDGEVAAYAETLKGDHRLYLLNLATGKKLFGMELLGNDKAMTHNSSFFWANNQRFVYSVPKTRTYTAIDRDGRNARSNLPDGSLIYRFQDEKIGRLLMTGQDIATGEGMGRNVSYFYPRRPYVHEVNPTVSVGGISRGMEVETDATPVVRVVENPGNVISWVVAADGQVRAGKEIRGTKYHTLYRENNKAGWVSLPGLDWSDPEAYPLGFSTDGYTLYVGRLTPEKTWGVYPYDLVKKTVGEPVLAHKKYDIVHPENAGYSNGVSLSGLIYTPKEQRLLGVRYNTEYPRVLWLDEEMAGVQAALDQALPQRINSITSMSDDLQKMVVLSWSSQDPGTYYLFDRKAPKLEKLMARMPWVDPVAMAEMKAIRFKARDGVMINGYITLPAGKPAGNLPLVVMPHNGTWGRHVWGYDAFIQFLASRGYAVLEVNPRGSAGYGEPFEDAADKHLVQAAVNDNADGVRWAIGQKLIDPRRVGIVGQGPLAGSYALMSLANEPEIYCCGVDGAGFTDWLRTIDRSWIAPEYFDAYVEKIGNPANSDEVAGLKESSPLLQAAKIKAPVLVMHDKQDTDFRYNQSKEMVAAIRQAGGTVELMDKYDEKYGYLTMAKYMNDTLAFLQKYMPADK
ncbi:MAG: S9 family peptidase [Opitutaceae bacterium]|nr:S9 family peptidase [Opitutaceae bacterium]